MKTSVLACWIAFLAQPAFSRLSIEGADRILFRAAHEGHAYRLKDAIVNGSSAMSDDVGFSGRHALVVDFNATEDKEMGGVSGLTDGLKQALAATFSDFAAQQSAFVADLLENVFRTPSHLPVAHTHTVVQNCDKYAGHLRTAGSRLLKVAEPNQLVETGGGFGFGFQVYCGCKLLLTSGGGFGSGMTVTAKAGVQPVAGGLGGGGGIQIFTDGKQDAGKEDTPILNVGGGGGGDLEGCGGSTDFGQVFPVASMQEAREALMSPQVQACPADKLSFVGGGGGGMGFTVTEPTQVAAYGGGLDLKFMSANAPANDAACGGKLLHGSAAKQDAGNYTAIANATARCRAQCANQPDLASLWACTCPCTQTEFQALNLTFATKMVCK